MNSLKKTIAGIEFTQVCWVVPDINTTSRLLASTLGVEGFPKPYQVLARDLKMTYRGQLVNGEWLTTQTYNGGSFVELVQPLSGKSMFHEYLARHPEGGIQHVAFRMQISDFDQVFNDLKNQGFKVISEVDHPIARMAFFDTYKSLGVATEIMGVTPDGWVAIEQMKNSQ